MNSENMQKPNRKAPVPISLTDVSSFVFCSFFGGGVASFLKNCLLGAICFSQLFRYFRRDQSSVVTDLASDFNCTEQTTNLGSQTHQIFKSRYI